jgi:outer membrane protein TolC
MRPPFALIFAAVSLVFYAQQASALTAREVLESAGKFYPKILAAAQKQAAARGNIQEKEGAFDATIEQSAAKRFSGFYDGQQLDTRLVKPFPTLNSRIYGGYRISDGNFPIYEDRLITTENGEALLGVELSLLRDNMIDSRRAALNVAEIEAEIAEIDLTMTRLHIQLEALIHYWQWVATGQQLKVLQSLLGLMEDRQDALTQRFERGDLAKIFLTENQQYILQRKAQIVDMQRAVQEAALRLSLFYRDSDGTPLIVPEDSLPASFPPLQPLVEETLLREIVAQHPELQRLQQESKAREQDLALGENALLPKADLAFEYSDDFGDGSISRQDAESVVKLKISIPLETNAGRGKINKAKAEIKQLGHMAKLRKEELEAQLSKLLVELKARKQAIELVKSEIEFAQQMVAAERQRFRAGGSDFFLINMREEALANARIKEIDAYTKYQLALAKLNALTLNLNDAKSG